MEHRELLFDRFRIDEKIGRGGMGVVYRAMDETTGEKVALKVVHEGVPEGRERFTREAAALLRLSHPGIVRYVAHGPSFVAMQWLEGRDLAARLRDGPLAIEDAVALAIQLAETIDHAHELGIVHRDLKPANLFFEGGDRAENLRIVDFGLAWLPESDFRSVTGVMLGTPGYMAPEQIRGMEVDARIDVFAIGCVLYRCLTGHGPFAGADAVATLAKVLFDDPLPPSSLRPAIPRSIDRAVLRMLSKERDERPVSARAIAAELRRASILPPSIDAPPSSVTLALTDRELRFVSVVVAARERFGGESETLRRELEPVFVQKGQAMRVAADRHGARLDIVPGATIALLYGKGSATDGAAAAARFALELRGLLPGVPIAVATGRAEIGQRTVGDAIDRAMARVSTSEEAIWIDDTTAGLLGAAFEVRADRGLELVFERPADMRVRTLLGKPTPCVGRDRELAFLDATLAECASDDVARVVLVTGNAGVGKSRLRYEWIKRLEQTRNAIWSCRADPIAAGAPFSLLAQLVRSVAGIDLAESTEASRARLRARVSAHAHASDSLRIAEFLGEMIGVPFPDDDDEGGDDARVQLRAARRDPMLMGDQIRRAWEDWLAAETRAGPVIVVLEDLHWGDIPSVKLVDYALGSLADSPLLVVAFARPDVKDSFPDLWKSRAVFELPIGDLSRGASTRLAKHVLGDVESGVIERIVERSAGNPFFLEELLRATAEGEREVPETVLAMVQRRLEALDPNARRFLRAASVFGETFWLGGVEHEGAVVVDLERRELITARSHSRFTGEKEYTFRHALIRDAAYATLTDRDRIAGHHIAGEWLEQRGERNAAVLAEHFDRGGDRARAVSHYIKATSQALEGSDLAAVVDRARRAAELGATGIELGELRRYQAEALRWRGELANAEAAAREATQLLPAGSPSWFAAVAELGTVAGGLAHTDVILEARSLVLDSAAKSKSESESWIIALARVIGQLYVTGQRALADSTMHELESRGAPTDPFAGGRLEQARAYRALYSSDQGTYYERMKDAKTLFEQAGDRRNACVQVVNMGYVAVVMGALDEAEAALVPALRLAETLGIVRIRAIFQQNLGLLRTMQGRHEESIALQQKALETFIVQGDLRLATFSRIYLSQAFRALGKPEEAFAEAERAVAESEKLLPAHASALATLADLELARDDDREKALAHAERAHALLEQLGGLEDTESLVRVVYAEALALAGRRDDARSAASKAALSIEARAAKISIERWRKSFLEVAENRRIRALAAKLA